MILACNLLTFADVCKFNETRPRSRRPPSRLSRYDNVQNTMRDAHGLSMQKHSRSPSGSADGESFFMLSARLRAFFTDESEPDTLTHEKIARLVKEMNGKAASRVRYQPIDAAARRSDVYQHYAQIVVVSS